MAPIKLSAVPDFSEMDDQEVAGIREVIDSLNFHPGHTIVYKGEPVTRSRYVHLAQSYSFISGSLYRAFYHDEPESPGCQRTHRRRS